jgi:hypothetical protein
MIILSFQNVSQKSAFIFFLSVHDRLAASFSNRQVNVYSGEGAGLITTANLRPHEAALTGMAFRYTRKPSSWERCSKAFARFSVSVADPGCTVYPGSKFCPSRIRILSIPDPGSESKNLSILTQKIGSKLPEI